MKQMCIKFRSLSRLVLLSTATSVLVLVSFTAAAYIFVNVLHPRSVRNLSAAIKSNVRVGDSKAQVEKWTKTQQFKYFFIEKSDVNFPTSKIPVNKRKQGTSCLFSRVWRAKFFNYCDFTTDIMFLFDKKGNLIWFSVTDNSTC